ncbi:MerC domain-containing protein [Ferrimonas marina]|uniref:MerC mercury resistance protein n=1 Tax=Ferrimonas marina TaxID=299255 RepID=A0A1M5MHI8_9GAMM|nr:MerC domain-containing protein [Ferrimonas marina]SHG76798.1 MerC mercury resistance protein [Ferrimonas marina]
MSSLQNQKRLDYLSIGMSLICMVHCLAVPVFLLLGATVPAFFADEAHFHELMLFFVIPVSSLAFFLGCRKHRDPKVVGLGLSGLATLLLAAFWAHDALGHDAETVITLVGTALLVLAHYRNYSLCRRCNCQH